MKIFLSHSHKDAELVRLFIQFLTADFHIPRDSIYCTSIQNQIKIGADFIQDIRDNIRESTAVMFFISNHYLESLFCIMEMGAAWAFVDTILPIFVPPVNIQRIKDSPLRAIQYFDLSNPDNIAISLYDKLTSANVITRMDVSQENEMTKNAKRLTRSIKQYFDQQKLMNVRIDSAKHFAISQNGNPEAIAITRSEGFVNIKCDFRRNELYSPQTPTFVSYVTKYQPTQDWSILSSRGYQLNISLCSPTKSIERITLELKTGEPPITVIQKDIRLSEKMQDVFINRKDGIGDNDLLNVSELCFVVNPNFVAQSGQGDLLIKINGVVN